MTDDEHRRLEVALLFLEIIIDKEEQIDTSISEMAWASHSYLQSVLSDATLPSHEAQLLFASLLSNSAIENAKTRHDPR